MGWFSAVMERRTFRVWALVAMIGIVGALAGGIALGTTTTCDSPATLAGSAFEIDADANQIVNRAGCIDWLDTSTESGTQQDAVIKPDTQSGSGDESFGNGTKEDTAEPSVVDGSIPPNKSDLKAFGVFTEAGEVTAGNPTGKFLELLWTRVQDPSGTTNMDFELNQKLCDLDATPTNCAANGITPLRTSGDKLITYDLSRGGTVATISIRTWNGSVWGSPTVLTQQNPVRALGTVNTSQITAGNSLTSLGALSPRTFGEASISFSALFGNETCGQFGSAYLKSRASDSFTAALKDFVPPTAVSISNCSELTTDATDSVTIGSPISDTATLSGVTANAGGDITFRAYSNDTCTNLVFTSEAVPVDGPGAYTSTPTFTPTAVGTYYWIASYSGDASNTSISGSCGDANEQSVVNKAKPNIVTNATASVTIGSPISDSATLSDGVGPTGTITFKLYGPDTTPSNTADNCSGTPVYTKTVDVANGNGTYSSGNFTPTAAGTYYWLASYSGDGNNEAATGACNDTGETSVVGKKQPAISTIATAEAIVGDPIKDTANLTGTTTNAIGTITFKLYDSLADCNANIDVKFTDTATVSGPGNYESDPYTPTVPGTYYWLASYDGDSNNLGVSGKCDDANEQTLVARKQPTITTSATPSVTIDSPISDTATLSGATANATGTITFKLYSDAACTNEVATGLQPVSIGSPNANGDYVVNSGNFKPTAVGTYYWIAIYSGDDRNLEVSGECGDANEQSVVNKAPSVVDTAQELFPQDSATVSATAGGQPTGTVFFALFATANCSGDPVFTETVQLSNGTANTDNTEFSVDESNDGDYKWRVVYSGDDTHEGETSQCGKEAFSATVDNDTTN